jgi:hypothetical protein
MIERDPVLFGTLTYLWVLGVSMFGGLASFIIKLNQSKDSLPIGKLFIQLIGVLIVAGFVGVATFFLCQAWQLDGMYTAFAVAVSGHLGAEAIKGLTGVWRIVMKVDSNAKS